LKFPPMFNTGHSRAQSLTMFHSAEQKRKPFDFLSRAKFDEEEFSPIMTID